MALWRHLDLRNILSFAPAYAAFSRFVSVSHWQEKFVSEILQARPGMRILDIGCGPADILKLLPKVDYVGFDMSARYIDKARRNYGDRGRFIHSPHTADIAAGIENFDCAMALGVLHHLNDDEALLLFETAKASLKSGQKLVTVDGAYTECQSLLEKLLLDFDRGNFVRTPEAYRGLAKRIFSDVIVTIHTDLLRIPYTHCIMTCRN